MTDVYALTMFSVEEIKEFWPHLQRMLDAVPHTWRHWTKEWIVGKIVSGEIQVWGIGPPPNAVLIFFTQISVYPAIRTLTVVWGAGSFTPSMLSTLKSKLTEFARYSGCDEIELRGRLGWEPSLKSIGFSRDGAVWSMKLPVRIN